MLPTTILQYFDVLLLRTLFFEFIAAKKSTIGNK